MYVLNHYGILIQSCGKTKCALSHRLMIGSRQQAMEGDHIYITGKYLILHPFSCNEDINKGVKNSYIIKLLKHLSTRESYFL